MPRSDENSIGLHLNWDDPNCYICNVHGERSNCMESEIWHATPNHCSNGEDIYIYIYICMTYFYLFIFLLDYPLKVVAQLVRFLALTLEVSSPSMIRSSIYLGWLVQRINVSMFDVNYGARLSLVVWFAAGCSYGAWSWKAPFMCHSSSRWAFPLQPSVAVSSLPALSIMEGKDIPWVNTHNLNYNWTILPIKLLGGDHSSSMKV